MRVLIIDNYDSFTYNLYQMVGDILAQQDAANKLDVRRNDDITLDEIQKKYDKVILSPGPGNPADKAYFGVCADVLLKPKKELPVLGVCLGMQGIAHYFGGKVVPSNKPMHGKTSPIKHNDKGVFAGIPQDIKIMRYHSLMVEGGSLPSSLEVTAVTNDATKEIMGIKHKEYPIEGIQFHPESFATQEGATMLKNFLSNEITMLEKNLYTKLLKEKPHLTTDEAYSMQKGILTGAINTEELVKIFSAIDGRYPTVEEMNGIIAATRESMLQVPIKTDTLDIVGTGGDGMRTFNISTVAAIVCAACNVPVVKHGSRSASSKCGSADVLEELGVNIMLEPEQAVKCFEEIGMVFLFAQRFHPALKNAAEARKQYGKKTYFNILGPLVNPAGVSHQTLGVYDEDIKKLMGEASIKAGIKKLWAVRSADGMDEASLFSMPAIVEFSKEHLAGKQVNLSYDMHTKGIEEIRINEVGESVKIILDVLGNKATEVQMQTVVINAAIGLMTFGVTDDLQTAREIASEAIKSGKALNMLNQLIKTTKHV